MADAPSFFGSRATIEVLRAAKFPSTKQQNRWKVTYIDWDVFSRVNEDDIIYTFMALQKRRPETQSF